MYKYIYIKVVILMMAAVYIKFVTSLSYPCVWVELRWRLSASSPHLLSSKILMLCTR